MLRPQSHYSENHSDRDSNVYGNSKKRSESAMSS